MPFKDKEKGRAYSRKHREEHREEKRIYDKEQYKEHPEKVAAKNKRFREKNPGYNKEWQEKNPEKCVAYSGKWQKKNPEKVAVKNKKYYEKLRQEILDVLGGECSICGSQENLEAHEKKGNKHPAGVSGCLMILRNPKRFGLLCEECHVPRVHKVMRELGFDWKKILLYKELLFEGGDKKLNEA